MRSMRIAAFALAAALGGGLLAGTASAMPLNGLTPAATQTADGVQDVAYVCGPYRCWWRPGPYWGGPTGGPGPTGDIAAGVGIAIGVDGLTMVTSATRD